MYHIYKQLLFFSSNFFSKTVSDIEKEKFKDSKIKQRKQKRDVRKVRFENNLRCKISN